MARLIEIQLTKYLLALTETELTRLLSRDPVLWQVGIRRGKWIRRGRRADKRLTRNDC